MAQGFYNAQEAARKLGVSEDELRKLVREGRLREFRDARGVMYKSGEIDALAAERGSAKEDSIADLMPVEEAPTKSPTPPPAAAEAAKEGSTMFSLEPVAEKDAAKTDVFSLEPVGEEGEGRKSGSGSGSSISLLDDLENVTIPADPMAETVVSAPGELETPGAGGSGLLDLARESDDTSLGAELYDDTGEEEGKAAAPAAAAAAPAPAAHEPAAVVQPEYYMVPAGVEVADPMTPGFVGMAVVGLLTLLVAGMAVAAAVMGTMPSLLATLANNLIWYLLGALVAAGVFWVIGWTLGRQAEVRRNTAAYRGAEPEV